MNSEAKRISVIYSGHRPRVFDDSEDRGLNHSQDTGLPWKLEFIEESSILNVPVEPRCDYLAVFFSCRNEAIARPLANIFPGAEIIAYEESGRESTNRATLSLGSLRRVQLPIAPSVAYILLNGLDALRSKRRAFSQDLRDADDLREFLDSFLDAIEASWDEMDRKVGIDMLMKKILNHLHAAECAVYLAGVGDEEKLHRAHYTGNIRDLDLFDCQANASIIGNVFGNGIPFVDNAAHYELKSPFSQESTLIQSILCYPIGRHGERIGVFEAFNSKRGEFTEEDRRKVGLLLDPLAVVLRSAAMYEDAERLIITDDLTRLFNYRYLMKYVDAEVKRCLRLKSKVSLLFIDIDGFKQINDTFGHLVGSQSLAEMGKVFRSILRQTDVVARYGGDEFVIVLPETPLNGALVIAERLRKCVEDYEFVAQNVNIRLTVSLGVANCPQHTLTAEGLIKKADAAMYRAKELSKNSIRVAV